MCNSLNNACKHYTKPNEHNNRNNKNTKGKRVKSSASSDTVITSKICDTWQQAQSSMQLPVVATTMKVKQGKGKREGG